MQTFVPLNTYAECARVLDPSRLGNQAYREGLTLLRGKWTNHPASKMWRGYEAALARYILACLEELEKRGRFYPNHFTEVLGFMQGRESEPAYPPWWGGPIHASHRAALLYKNPEWYGQFGWEEEPKLDYVWPVS